MSLIVWVLQKFMKISWKEIEKIEYNLAIYETKFKLSLKAH